MQIEFTPRRLLVDRLRAGWRLIAGHEYAPHDYAVLMHLPEAPEPIDERRIRLTAMRFAPTRDGDRAGLVAFQSDEYFYALTVTLAGGRPVIQVERRAAERLDRASELLGDRIRLYRGDPDHGRKRSRVKRVNSSRAPTSRRKAKVASQPTWISAARA